MYNSTMTNTFPYGYGSYNIGGSTLPQQGGRQANGGNAQAAFYAYAQKMGVDPNEILNMMKGQQ